MQSDFAWSKALGTAATTQATREFTPDDPFNPEQPENYSIRGHKRVSRH